MDKRELEFSDDKSHKFWHIERDGSDSTVTYGRIGTDGQSKTKSFDDEAAAKAHYDKQVQGKLKKGYADAGSAAAANATPASTPPSPTASTTASPTPASAAQPAAAAAGGFRDLADGESTEMQGSAAKLTNQGGVYSCSCPAWRNQSKPIEARTCKHIRKLRGDAAEQERLGGDFTAVRKKSSAKKKDGPPILLAESWDNETDVTGWWISEKLDGVRAYWDGKKFLSRQGNEYKAPDWFTAALPPEPLDGELWLDRGAFQKTVSIVRRQDRGGAWEEIRYVVFDAPAQTTPFEERMDTLASMLHGVDQHISVLEQTLCQGLTQLRDKLARVEALGGEGLMLRQPGSLYHAGRSFTLLKVKTFHDAEATVLEHQAGKGRHKGRMGALLVELDNGTKFSVGTGFSDKERENPPAIGSQITFRYQELTKAGVPRFPSYVRQRTDK